MRLLPLRRVPEFLGHAGDPHRVSRPTRRRNAQGYSAPGPLLDRILQRAKVEALDLRWNNRRSRTMRMYRMVCDADFCGAPLLYRYAQEGVETLRLPPLHVGMARNNAPDAGSHALRQLHRNRRAFKSIASGLALAGAAGHRHGDPLTRAQQDVVEAAGIDAKTSAAFARR